MTETHMQAIASPHDVPRIYLDHAATSWPKPESVYQAIDRCQRQLGIAAGRGITSQSLEATHLLQQTRASVARLLGAEHPDQIVITPGGTLALNLAIHGWLRPGDHAICTAIEHNSVLRPLHHWQDRQHGSLTIVPCDSTGWIDPTDIERALRPNTRLVAINHASNVTGRLQSIADVGALCRRAEVKLLVDAAQSLGHTPINVRSLGIDLLAASGHKGLLGPLGTGLLYTTLETARDLAPLWQGGTGSESESPRQPANMPDRFEAGSLNLPAIAGLGAGIDYLLEHDVAHIQRREEALIARLIQGLEQTQGVTVYAGRLRSHERVPLVSMNLAGYDPQELAMLLDASCHVQTRPGLHCAPLIHQVLGTDRSGGTLRCSVGAATQEADIDAALAALTMLVRD